MSRIESTFRRLGKANQVAAIPYLPVGIPDVQTSRLLLPIIGRQGADLIALGTLETMGLPQEEVSATGASLDDCLRIAAEARRTNEVPLVLVSTVAEAQEYGFEGLAVHCAQAGVDGLLMLDMEPSDFRIVAPVVSAAGVDAIVVFSGEAQDWNSADPGFASGFVYCGVSDRPGFADLNLSDRVKGVTDLPLVVGVDAEMLASLPRGSKAADGVLARSGMGEIITSHPEYEVMLEVSDHVRVIQDSIGRAGW